MTECVPTCLQTLHVGAFNHARVQVCPVETMSHVINGQTVGSAHFIHQGCRGFAIHVRPGYAWPPTPLCPVHVTGGEKNTDVPDRAQSLTFYLFATRSIQPATMLHDRCSFSPHPLAGSRASERGLSSDRGLSRSLQTRTCLCWPSSLATSMRLVPVSAQ